MNAKDPYAKRSSQFGKKIGSFIIRRPQKSVKITTVFPKQIQITYLLGMDPGIQNSISSIKLESTRIINSNLKKLEKIETLKTESIYLSKILN